MPASNISPTWPQAPRAAKDAPSIVLILLDDVGFGAAGTFGGPSATPALDRLAAEGLRYNQFHTTGTCSPTRAALLTGRNHHRASFGRVSEIGNSSRGYNSFWPKSVVSLPEVLRRNGYSTAAFGKWHNTQTWEISPVGPFDRWPTGLGFEYFYGFMLGEASQWETPLYRNTTPVEPVPSAQPYNANVDLVDDAIRWVHTHESIAPDKPYFLYFAPGAIHSPLHVPQEWIDRYKGKFDQGWDRLREETFARQKALGVIPANADLTLRPKDFPAWDSLSADQKRLYAHQAEVYAAFLEQTDHEVGRLLDSIRTGPNADNTLVLYVVGDNGASAEGGHNGSDFHFATLFTGEETTSVEQQLKHIDKLGGREFDNHVAAPWAWAMNTPFQWTKIIASHFGGTRNPLVVSWPAHIKDIGGLRTQFSHVNDIAPTIYDLLGIKFPKTVDGVKQEPLDGTSLVRTFSKPGIPSPHRVQYFEMMGNRAIYKDGWIASAFHALPLTQHAGDFDHDVWELYHIDEDFSQAHNVADRYPEKLKALKKVFDSEADKNYVYPLVGVDFNLIFKGRPTIDGGRKDFLYYGTMPGMPVTAVPLLLGSHRITVKLYVPKTGTNGVLVADGGRYGGFSLYVSNGKLVYEQNYFGIERSVIAASTSLPVGAVEVAFDFIRQGEKKWGGGLGRLTVNGEVVGEGSIAHVGYPSFVDTFDIGADRTSPVSESYASPAPFTGKVNEVRIHLD